MEGRALMGADRGLLHGRLTCLVAPYQQRFGSLEIVITTNGDLDVSGAEVADLPDIASESRLQFDMVSLVSIILPVRTVAVKPVLGQPLAGRITYASPSESKERPGSGSEQQEPPA